MRWSRVLVSRLDDFCSGSIGRYWISSFLRGQHRTKEYKKGDDW